MQLQPLIQQQTMSSREIGVLVESRHSDVIRSIERLMESGDIGRYAPTPYTHQQNNQTYMEYLVGKRDSYVIVAQLSPAFTARLVDRWQELEAMQANQAPAFQIPTTLSGALRLAAEQAETIEQQQARLALQAPAVAFVDRYVEAKSSKNLSDVAKILGLNPHAFIETLSIDQIIFKRGGSWVPFQHHIDIGRFTVKTGVSNGHDYSQARVEPKGVEWLASRYGVAK